MSHTRSGTFQKKSNILYPEGYTLIKFTIFVPEQV